MMDAGTSPVAAGAMSGFASGPRVRMEDSERLEDYLRAYVGHDRFKSRYPRAHERCSDTLTMLWRADSRAKVVALADKAREAMREFACALVEWHEPYAELPDATDTLLRLSSVVEMYKPHIGEERCGLHEALFNYWDALCNAVQRHEDPAQRVHGRLRWEDGRRVVLLTALVMVEVDRCL